MTMIDPCARAEVLADAILDTLEGQKKTPPQWDHYDMAACSLLTIMAIHGGSMATQRRIAAELRREFVRREP